MAIGHFNISDLVLLKAVFSATRELDVPIIVGVSQEERNFLGIRQIATLVHSLRDEFEFPIFLNADHTHSLPEAVRAAKAGFDAVVFDSSEFSFDENVRRTSEAVEALKSVNRDILLEGELGDKDSRWLRYSVNFDKTTRKSFGVSPSQHASRLSSFHCHGVRPESETQPTFAASQHEYR